MPVDINALLKRVKDMSQRVDGLSVRSEALKEKTKDLRRFWDSQDRSVQAGHANHKNTGQS